MVHNTKKGTEMVYDKVRSGDPDYDDKQPPEFHAGNVVSAGDGVFFSDVAGFTDANGAHVNMDDQDASDRKGDNRPTPGNVASAASDVQDYSAEDTPTVTHAEYTKDEDTSADTSKAKPAKSATASKSTSDK